MSDTERELVLFRSTHLALSAERAARKAGIPVRMVVVPRRLSPDCNMGMAVGLGDGPRVRALLDGQGIEHG